MANADKRARVFDLEALVQAAKTVSVQQSIVFFISIIINSVIGKEYRSWSSRTASVQFQIPSVFIDFYEISRPSKSVIVTKAAKSRRKRAKKMLSVVKVVRILRDRHRANLLSR